MPKTLPAGLEVEIMGQLLKVNTFLWPEPREVNQIRQTVRLSCLRP